MKTDLEEYEEQTYTKRSTFMQFFLGFFSYLCTISPSMSLGFSAVALPALQANEGPNKLTMDQLSWVASIASIATPLGCFLSGPLSDRFGRKSALLWINVVSLIGWTVISAAYYTEEYQYRVLLVGRLVTGLSTGLASMPAAVYMAEVASPKLRGTFTTATAIFFGLGVFIVYLLGAFLKDDWGTLSLISAVIPCVSFVLCYFLLQETPQWLVSKNRIQEARENMRKIYGFKEVTPEINEEISALIRNRDKNKVKGVGDKSSLLNSVVKKFKQMTRPTFWKPFLLLVAFFFFQQFSGLFVVIFYAIDIVKNAGITLDPYVVILLIALARIVGGVVVSGISRTYGKKPLSTISGASITLSMLLLSTYQYMSHTGGISEEVAQVMSWLAFFLMVFYFFMSTIGFLSMPFAMNAELFPVKIKGLATGIVSCIAYAFNFVTIKTYPSMVVSMGSYGVFLFYGLIALLGTFFVIVFLPETKGKTLEEIEEYFGKQKEDKEVQMKILQDKENGLS